MCGFVAILSKHGEADRKKALRMSAKIRHRGPDWSGVYSSGKAVLAHERLAIVDPLSGSQPLYSADGKKVLAVNGEIYNHHEIRRRYAGRYDFKTGSDCEVILALYEEYGADFIDQLNGIFAFALYDSTTDSWLIARDHMGVIPLYIGCDKDGTVYAASELKALEGQCDEYEPFPPGHFLSSQFIVHSSQFKGEKVQGSKVQEFKGEKVQEFKDESKSNYELCTMHSELCSMNYELHRWYQRDWFSYDGCRWSTADDAEAAEMIRDALMAAVKRQLMSDVPYGVLLSGGLDSSVVSAIAKQYAAKRIESGDKHDAWWPQLHSFAVGLKGAPDLAKAREVADHIGTIHHEINYTIQEGLDAIRDVIYYTETYDVTTVRASTPMYLLARVIRSMGIKMVLSGEGADEIFGGYLYFHKAPDAREFHEETVRKLMKLHYYDCLRANKSLMAWGIEGRVPFLDKEFMDTAMSIHPRLKMCPGKTVEKKVVREAFAHLLPPSVAWRQKEQFSDGVGYSWIDTLKKVTSEAVSDEEMAHAAERFPVNPPLCKEEYYYRSIFEEHFPSPSAARCVNQERSVACSTATALAWDEAFRNMNEPSGRAVKGVHEQAAQCALPISN